MKKLVALFAMLAFCLCANAQFTVIGGLTTTTGKWSESVKTENFSQFHVGVGACCRLGPAFALLPALVYNVKGMTFQELKDGNWNLKERTSYLEIPVQIQLHVPLLPKILDLMAIGEPFVSYAISRQYQEGGSDWTEVSDWGDAKRFRYGVGLGAGVELFSHIQVSARYIWDFAGSEFSSLGEVPKQILDGKSSGLKVSAALIF